ncbi:glycoside hydrolase family 15 protein [Sphingomicrobium aestuariivivum]|uniref:glycoside hydrolase family 15 protein n=1 Tax=Sphingomicrobium aestuariivivum TaxID=1582356 RepID=UPI001FD7247C|nr:glycoside hydrolase family 15 protein [Sphingomicrobium aestuariivivum]MCJ8189822.1 glycoside hydrolase family 15 protein [Sphingomicrobium aestuariivivum]
MTEKTLNLWPIGNCQVSALVDDRAGFVWGCQPQVDGDPLFCSLLEPKGDGRPGMPRGEWRFELEKQVSAEPRYLGNSPILVTRLTDEDGGAVDVYDFCPRFMQSGRLYRPVAYARIVRPVTGGPRLSIRLNPANHWGAENADRTRGSNHVRFLTDPAPLRLSTDAPVGRVLDGRPFRIERDLAFFLGADESFQGAIGPNVARMMEKTKRHWMFWVRGLAVPLDWQEVVIRCAITLKLCQHEETGAIVAALTTSIPEAPGSERNWDYRYCWIRDAYYTVQALNRLGALDVLEGYLFYLRDLVDGAEGEEVQPLYGVGGNAKLEEGVAECLAGYRGMGPVRIGNAAFTQSQHDAYGQIVLSNAQAFFDKRLFRAGDEADFHQLEAIGEKAAEKFDEPDAGLWEFRTRASVHTYSSVMCWAACDRLANIAGRLGLEDREQYWQAKSKHIRDVIEQRAWCEEKGRYSAIFDGDELDASLLQLVDMRFVEADDERFRATLAAVEKGLRHGNQMLRYASEDDFGLPETAFNFCTFWLIEALHRVGRDEEARELFEATLERLTPACLLSEDTDFKTGELWGNYPQTYSLVGLINCAMLLSRPWSSVR